MDSEQKKGMVPLEDNPTRLEGLVDDNVAAAEESISVKRKFDELMAKYIQLEADLEAERQQKVAERQLRIKTEAEREAETQDLIKYEAVREAETQDIIKLQAEKEFWTGSFYANLWDLWTIEKGNVSDGRDWANFRRNLTPAMSVKSANSNSKIETLEYCPYLLTVSSSNAVSIVPMDRENVRSSSGTATTKQKIWPRDFAGNPYECIVRPQVAHLLPAAKQDHEQWLDIAAAVLGLPQDAPLAVKLKGLRGSKMQNEEKRENDTGVVHFITNKVLMETQLWDGNEPEFMLIPCMTMADAKAWNGEGYCAIAIAGTWIGEKVVEKKYQVCDLYCRLGLAKASLYPTHTLASLDQIASAQMLLKDNMMALADYVHGVSITDDAELPQAVKTIFQTRKVDRNWNEIPLPASRGDPKALKRVCLVSFESHDTIPTGHPAPDPMLLGMKAAVVWSHMTSFILIANGENNDDYYDEDSEVNDDLLMEDISTDGDNVIRNFECGVSVCERPIQQSPEWIP